MTDHEHRDGTPGIGETKDSSGLSSRHFLRDTFVGAATISIGRNKNGGDLTLSASTVSDRLIWASAPRPVGCELPEAQGTALPQPTHPSGLQLRL